MSLYQRTELLLGKDGVEKLKNSRVVVFGLGGVGGYVVEALVRAGVGQIDLIDNDTINETNLNRQIIATTSTIGMLKTEAFKERILSINPNCKVKTYAMFFMPENSNLIDFNDYDYVVDAVDTVTAKIEIIVKAKTAGVNVISSMGTGNKLDATAFKVADIKKTSVCPLAKVLRKELKERNIDSLKVVYSEEQPIKKAENLDRKEKMIGSVSFVPSVAGLIIAGEVIKDIIKQ